jgi:hypothetical protein
MTAKRIDIAALVLLIGVPIAWYALLLVIGLLSSLTY